MHDFNGMDILSRLYLPDTWQQYLEYKQTRQHLSRREEKHLQSYIDERRYVPLLEQLNVLLISREASAGNMDMLSSFPPLPEKRLLSKSGTAKKRVVYTYPEDFNLLLKAAAFLLHRYDSILEDNCYAFRSSSSVRRAFDRIRNIRRITGKYTLKADISNYFNSIDVPLLLKKLAFLKEEDAPLFRLFEYLLTVDQCICGQEVICEKRGAMAGTPMSPFFANVYLIDIDRYFSSRNILYFRYSDDILIFADTQEELNEYQNALFGMLKELRLTINPDKLQVTEPGEGFTFLGFSFRGPEIDLSDVTLRKIKGKIHRKADTMRRWQRRRNLSPEKAAVGFIHAMNNKFFSDPDEDDFTWCRWFFPVITTDKSLKIIDLYMQDYIRYCVTGRHYKGNYRIPYEQLKAWGYRSLVHEYYLQKEQKRL